MEPDYPPIVLPPSPPRRWRFTIGGLLALTFFAGCLFSCIGAMTHYSTEENVPSVDWLPSSVTNVSYYKSYSFTAYEFDISESEFKAWTNVELLPIINPVRVYRYSKATGRVTKLRSNASSAEYYEHLECDEGRAAIVRRGLYYSHRRNNGGGITVVYDRENGRAYFQSNPR